MTREELPSPKLHAPASREAIEAEERALNTIFPESLKRFLLIHNGGQLYGLLELYGVGAEHPYPFHAINPDFTHEPRFPAGCVIFATDGGMGLYCFDPATRGADGECDLFYWSWEERVREPVGRTFEDFLHHLEARARLWWNEPDGE
jgi:hypothetical protein